MGIKSTTVYDLVCDNCGEVLVNRNRIPSQELSCKAGELGWKVDNDHKYYCPKCKDATPDLIMKYHWPNYFRMSIAEHKIENKGNKKSIIHWESDEDNLVLMVDNNSLDNDFYNIYIEGQISGVSEWEKTISKIEFIEKNKKTIFKKLRVDSSRYGNDFWEITFIFEDKEEMELN